MRASILDVMRRDPVMRSLYWALPAGVVIGIVAASMARLTPADPEALELFSRYVLLNTWVVVAFQIVVPSSYRCTRFDLALPIQARRLWLAHTGAVLLAVLGVVLTAAVVTRLALWTGETSLRGVIDLPALALRLLAAVTLAHAVLQSKQPTLFRIPFGLGYLLTIALVLLGGTLIVFVELPPGGVALLFGSALLGYVHTYRHLPEAFALQPRAPQARGRSLRPFSPESGAAGAAGTGATGRGLSSLTLLRILTGWLGVIYLPAIAFFGALVAGGVLEEDMRSFGALNLTLLVFSWVVASVGRLRWLDPLPISRRRLFAAVMIPALVATGLGYALANRLGGRSARPEVDYRPLGSSNYVHVPPRFHRLAWDGVAPLLESPWGEAHPAWSTPLLRGLPPVLYAPFHAPEEASVDFVALQISRAAEAVYAHPIPPEQIRDRYLRRDARGTVRPVKGGLSLLEDHPGLVASSPRGRTLATLLFVGLPLLLTVALVLRVMRVFVRGGDLRRFSVGLAAFFMVGALAFVGAAIARITRPWVLSATLDILGRQLTASSATTALAWAATLVLLVLAYRLGERQYERLEAPALPRDTRQDLMRHLGLGD